MFTALKHRNVEVILFMVVVFGIVAVLFMALPAFAQEPTPVPPEPPPAPTLPPDLVLAFEAFLRLITDLTFTPLTAAFVVAGTAMLKKLLPSTISAGAIAITLQVLVWAALVAARHFGYESQFISGLDALTAILAALTGLLVSAYGAEWGYQKLSARGVPILGDSRS